LFKRNSKFHDAVMSHLPERFKDPFHSVTFTRLGATMDDDDTSLGLVEEPRELDDEDILKITKKSVN